MKDFINFDDHKKQLLKNPKFKKGYDELEEEYALHEKIIKKRIETGMTQKELDKRMGTQKNAVIRMEDGSYNPSFQYLRSLARAFGCKLKIEFV